MAGTSRAAAASLVCPGTVLAPATAPAALSSSWEWFQKWFCSCLRSVGFAVDPQVRIICKVPALFRRRAVLQMRLSDIGVAAKKMLLLQNKINL